MPKWVVLDIKGPAIEDAGASIVITLSTVLINYHGVCYSFEQNQIETLLII